MSASKSQSNAAIHNVMDWKSLVHEYQLDAKRLQPWDSLTSPFGGAYCVVRAGTVSLEHSHNEHEMFLCVKGRANVVVGDETFDMKMGDLIKVPLNAEHYIDNPHDEDFHFFTVWWDKDTARSYIAKDTELE